MEYPYVRPGFVPHAVILAAGQRGRKRAAHYAQRRRQHQQGHQTARRDGIPGNASQALHQPARPYRPHCPRRQAHSHRENAHHQQPQRNQSQRRPQQQRKVHLQLSSPQAAGQRRASIGNLPPQKGDNRQRQQVQIIAMDERRARRPRPLLPKLYNALACRRQGGQRQHQHGQRRAGRPHPEGLPRQRHRRAGRRGVKHQPAQAPGQQRREQRAGRQRRPRQ